LVAAIALLGVAAGYIYNLSQIPMYASRVTLEVQPGMDRLLPNRNPDSPTDSSLDALVRATQSRTLRQAVKGKLVSASPSFQFQPSQLSRLATRLGLPSSSNNLLYRQIIDLTARNLRVRQAGFRSIELYCESPDPSVAASYLTVLVDEINEWNLQTRLSANQRSNDWLTRQLAELRTKLERAEAELLAYSRSAGFAYQSDRNDKDTIAEEKLRSLQTQLAQAQVDRFTKQSLYETTMLVSVDTLPSVVRDGTFQHYQSQIAELKRRRAELMASFTPAHYMVKREEAQIAELENTLKQESAVLRNRIRTEYNEARNREKMLTEAYTAQAAVVSEQAQKSIHYNMLRREAEASARLYSDMLAKVKEMGINLGMQPETVRMIDSPFPSTRPVRPNPVLNCMMGLMVGLGLGVAMVLFRHAVDRTMKSPGETSSLLRIPELGVIPSAALDSRLAQTGITSSLRRLIASDNGFDGCPVELVTWKHKGSLLGESFLSVLASLQISESEHPRQIVVVASPAPQEGKSTVTSNLAVALAGIKRRVLLIDADLRRPRQARIFEQTNSWGLSDLLQADYPMDQYPLQSLCRETRIPNLWLLPAGPAASNISGLFYSVRLRQLMSRLREEFDIVIIDTPPLLEFVDARLVARNADGVVLVLRARHSSREDALAVANLFERDDTAVIGSVFNDWNPDSGGKGYFKQQYHYQLRA
jgi:capsular exopolysaccharide synthesis family protein